MMFEVWLLLLLLLHPLKKNRYNNNYVQQQQQYNNNHLLLLIGMLLTFFVVLVQGYNNENHENIQQQQQHSRKNFPYLYALPGNPNASAPIQEYIAKQHLDYTTSNKDDKSSDSDIDIDNNNDIYDDDDDDKDNNHPDFIYKHLNEYRIVEFYVHWCSACQTFKPKYIALAKQLVQYVQNNNNNNYNDNNNTSTSIKLSIYAVSCAPNRPLCKSLSIDRYPLFRIYQPNDTYGIDIIQHSQINIINILNKMGINTENIDNEEEFLLSDDDKNDNTNIDTTISSTSWMTKWSTSLFHNTDNNKNNANNVITTSENKIKRKSRDELRDDIHSSFDYTMRQGVYITDGSLPKERSGALFDFLVLLRKTLPISWKILHNSIEHLIDNFDYVIKSEEYLIAFLNEYPPPSINEWSMLCTQTDNVGYNCGLWCMFHTITVGVVDYNKNIIIQNDLLATENVALTIKNFIQYFFPCDICRINFITSYNLCTYDRCDKLSIHTSNNEDDWIELPIWLYKVHNAVNIRLYKEKSGKQQQITKQDEINILWPSRNDCQRCWLIYDRNNKFNTTNIYKLLKLEYGSRDAISTKYKKELYIPLSENEKEILSSFNTNKQDDSLITKMKQSIIPSVSQLFTTTTNQKQQEEEQYYYHTEEELKINIHISIDYLFRYHIKNLTTIKATIMLEFLTILYHTLPSTWITIHTLINEIIDEIWFIVKTPQILILILNDYKPINDQWVGHCARHNDFSNNNNNIDEESLLSSYDCGLWELLHVITVRYVHYNRFIATNDIERIPAMKIVHIISDFMEHFYYCKHCATEFINNIMCTENRCIQLIDNVGTESNWVELPIWMYQVHNDVTIHIMKNKAKIENKEFIESDVTLWPSHNVCTLCWNNNNEPNIEYIYKFLLLEYGMSTPLSVGLDYEDFAPGLQEINNRNNRHHTDASSFLTKLIPSRTTTKIFSSSSLPSEETICADASYAFDRMARIGLFLYSDEPPSKERAELFHKWLLLLDMTLPATSTVWQSMREVVKELLENFAYATKTKDYLIAVLDEFPPAVQGRRSADCMKITESLSDVNFCGYWELIHVVSIGYVTATKNAANPKDRNSPSAAASVIARFFSDFLEPYNERQAFVNAIRTCEEQRCSRLDRSQGNEASWIQVSLWSAKLRNEVMKQRNYFPGKEGRDNAEVNGYWPPLDECSKCWNGQGRANDDVLYQFLRERYDFNRRRDILSDEL